ncbi:MAG: 5'-nucleotidase C-terminal domain-containing protein, partial [Lachnospiraceae bacterium]|nr:5'-nucleotidase C-terminal domain-containing protein [Lachnospiraceae bacterium]
TPTTSTPTFFQDSNGEYIYGFCQGSDGSKLYEAVQGAVDKAKAEGADYIVLLAHLGIEDEVTPYKSTDVIKNTTGIDAVLDGHSHSIVEMEKVRNKEGHDVLLSQTGTKLAAIGKLTIDSAGNMRTELITDYEKKDVEVTKAIAAEYEVFEDKLNEVISTADFDLRINTEDGKTRLVRNNETNLGDFVADAYKYVTDAEIAISCGGSVRHNIDAGDITYSDILNVNPFSNYMLKRKISGNELLDVLEYSVHAAPSEFGGFLQVSGLTFDVDLSVPTPVLTDLEGTFIGFEGEQRRVSNVKVNGEPLLPDRIYEVGGVSYTLKDGGDGYAMFTGEEVDIGRYIEDVDAIVEYLRSKDGKVPEEYEDREGQERINFIEPVTR